MALNFPSSPALGQKHPVPSVVGVPTYTWDGEKWTTLADAAGASIYVSKTGDSMSGHLTPNATGTVNLGSAVLRWATIYTSDLSLNNGVGDWTIVEGEDDLFLHNNKRGKTYKFALTEVDPSTVPPKKV